MDDLQALAYLGEEFRGHGLYAVAVAQDGDPMTPQCELLRLTGRA